MSRTTTLVAGAAGLALLLAPLATSSAHAADPSATASSKSSVAAKATQHKLAQTNQSKKKSLTQADGEAKPVVTTSNVDAGKTVTFKASGCSDVDGATGTIVGIWTPDQADSDGPKTEVKLDAAGGSATYKTTEPGFYSAIAKCVNEAGESLAVSEQADAFAYPTTIGFSKDSWTEGDPLDLTTFGFTQGEKVTVTMTFNKTGKSYWNTSLTASVADEATVKNVFKSVVLPNTGPQGNYTLTFTGANGLVRTGQFYWGKPDAPAPTPTPSKSSTATPDRPGLPSTGV